MSGSTTDGVIVGWIALCLVMLAHRRLRQESIADRAPGTWLGIFVQAMAFSVIWTMRRDPASLSPLAAAFLSGTSGVCGLAAVLLALASIWTLGRHWSVEGRLLPGHELVRHGPYAYVRHPIYTSMLGMLLATGLSSSRVVGLAGGVALLWQRFGADFERYAGTVPSFLPFARPRPAAGDRNGGD